MAWSETSIAELEAAIASGVLMVTYSGPPSRQVQYQSTSEMLKALAQMRAEVRSTPNYRRVTFKRGCRDDG